MFSLLENIIYNAAPAGKCGIMVTLVGPLATLSCEPRQARKGATVAIIRVPGCGWLELPPLIADCGDSLFNYPVIK